MKIFRNKEESRLRAGWRLLIQFIVMVAILIVSALGLGMLLPTSLTLTSATPFFIGVITSIWFASRYLDKRPHQDYGLVFNNQWAKEYLVGVGVAATAMTVIFVIEWQAGWLAITGYGWNAHTEIPFGIGISSFFVSMLLVGFHEELFSRGYQILNITEGISYPALGYRGAIIIAVLLTSSLFGVLHMGNPNASAISTFNIILAGVVLAIPYIITGSLALSAGLHFSWNFCNVRGLWISGKWSKYLILNFSYSAKRHRFNNRWCIWSRSRLYGLVGHGNNVRGFMRLYKGGGIQTISRRSV